MKTSENNSRLPEWIIGKVLKTFGGASRPWVRIPHLLPDIWKGKPIAGDGNRLESGRAG